MKESRLGGLAWLAALQFFVAEAFAARSVPGYTYRLGYISDLGAVRCAEICSPRHAWMNGAFVLQGALIPAGLALSRRSEDLGGRLSVAALAACAIGVAVVGIAPEDTAPGWHYFGATLNLVFCNVGALAGGLSRGASGVARSGIVAGAVGLGACAALALSAYGDIGVGAVERLAAYPFLVWLAANGASRLLARDGGGGA